jgi:hypothetical protein
MRGSKQEIHLCLSRPKIARPAGQVDSLLPYASKARQRLAVTAYLTLLSDRRFLAFWGGFTISATGDAMTRVALVWYVLDKTG